MRKVQPCQAEGSDASRCGWRQTLRGVSPERSEGLRVTRCDCSNCQVQFVQIEPCLNETSPRCTWGLVSSGLSAVDMPEVIACCSGTYGRRPYLCQPP